MTALPLNAAHGAKPDQIGYLPQQARDILGLDDYIAHLVDFLEELGPGTHLMAICQPISTFLKPKWQTFPVWLI